MSRKKTYLALCVFVIAFLLPILLKNSYYRHVLIMVFMWTLLGTAWNLMAGYTGQVSFGHASFFGVGAYSAGLLTHHLGISPWWGMLAGGAVAVVFAIPMGLVCFRLRGPYFALSILALAEVLRLVATNWVSFTNGMLGILVIPTFKSKIPYYYVIVTLAALSLLMVRRMVSSKLGYWFLAIREDQDAAESMGIPTTRYKMFSLCISAFLTGTAGSFYLNYMGFIDPSIVFSLPDISIMVILVVIIGGVGTIWGPAIGAGVMVVLSEVVRNTIGDAHLLVMGVLVVGIIMFLPQGVGGWKFSRQRA